MVNTYIDPTTGKKYQEVTTNSEELPDGTVVTNSTWVLVETSEIKEVSKKKVGISKKE